MAAPVPAAEQSSRTRWRWIAALAVTSLWIAALAVLALKTANPVTVNRVQIEDATAVLKGRVIDADKGLVELTPDWKPNGIDSPKELTIENLKEASAKSGQEYLIPVTRHSASEFSVTPTRGRRVLVYPATPEVAAEVERLLDGE